MAGDAETAYAAPGARAAKRKLAAMRLALFIA
jgi:hypothetical protein